MAEGLSSVHSGLPFAVKPDTPQIFSQVDISEEATLEATVQWAPPVWPPQKVLICQFRYKECQAEAWTRVSVWASFLLSLQRMGQHPESYRAQSHLVPVTESPQVLHRWMASQATWFICCLFFEIEPGYVVRLAQSHGPPALSS